MWCIEKVLQFSRNKWQQDGFVHFGFHDSTGRHYVLDFDLNWVGELNADGSLKWTAGPTSLRASDKHIPLDIDNPVFVSTHLSHNVLIASYGNKRVYSLNPTTGQARVLIDGQEVGFRDLGNCQVDMSGDIWINEITGCKVWWFDANGKLKGQLGTGSPGFQREPVGFAQVEFNWVYDLRLGPDGNLYVLDSKNFAVRRINKREKVVELVAGCGEPGYSGDGFDPCLARLGGNPSSHFDGPWSLSLNEAGNIFIGDTQNHVVRMVDQVSNRITTIAGCPQLNSDKDNRLCQNPLELNIPLICSLDYHQGRLFIPEWDGELIVLKEQAG